MVWRDDFDGPQRGRPDLSKWVYDTGHGNSLWGNNEWQTYTSSAGNVRLDGQGHLFITARKEADGSYTSGRLKTKGKFAQRYGRFEARIKIPRGPGLLPAFWLMGDKGQWPANGEIDVMENVGDAPETVFSNVHAPGLAASGTHQLSRELSEDFHVYGIEWSPGRIAWSLDGTIYRTLRKQEVPAGAQWVFDDQPFYMLLNVAVGGDWPGNPIASVLPQDMVIDWVQASSYTP